MKFGTYFAYWEQEWTADIIPYFDKVRRLGFDILEISAASLVDRSDGDIAKIKDAAKDNGIAITTCIGLPAEYNLASEDEKIRENGIAYMKRLLSGVHKVGADLLGGIIYAYWPCDYSKPIRKEAARAASIKSMRTLGRIAGDLGIVLAMETVNRFEQFIINDAREAVEFVKDIGLQNCGVMLDTFHMNIEEDNIGEAIVSAGDYLVHFHIGECNRKVPGKGHMPWDEIGEALRRINYTKGVVMEPFVKMGGQVGNDIKVFRDMSGNADAKTMDDDIGESLKFLKSKFLAV